MFSQCCKMWHQYIQDWIVALWILSDSSGEMGRMGGGGGERLGNIEWWLGIPQAPLEWIFSPIVPLGPQADLGPIGPGIPLGALGPPRGSPIPPCR